MITEKQAVEHAWNLVHRERIRVRGFRSAHMDAAPAFLPEWAARGDVWKVVFDLDVRPGMSPDLAVIIVDRETGEAATVELT
jgi:hypothetical protein